MKFLHLLGQDQDIGGVLSVIRNLQQATAHQNWSHVAWVNQAYVETRRPALTYRLGRHACGDSPNHAILLVRAFRGFFELKQLLSRESFDVLHAHTRGMLLVALMVARGSGREIAFTNHNFARRVGLYRWAARQSGMHTIVLTPNMARHYGLAETQPGVSIISACCADDFFSHELSSRSASRAPKDPVRLVGVGNVVRWKNWHLAAEALRRLTPEERSRFEFVHWGPIPSDRDSARYGEELRRFIGQHNLQDQMVFRGPSVSVSDCLREADWFVLPSTNEPCSVALIEALASGLPALVSASGGNVDIVLDGKTGWLFQPDNPEDLAAKFRQILASDRRLLPPNQIRETVRSRSASAVALEYAKVYRRICDRLPADPIPR